jgi:putative two-component system response regulator
LHDIGKITVADRILCKPGKLTEAEFSEMKLHTTKGEQLIQRAFHSDPKIGKIATDIALYHHEKYDGSGYPHELSGEAIPLSARIVSLVDVFDALINKRVYKDSWHINDVLHYIKEHSGTQFDPKIVQLFLNNSDCFLNVLNKYGEDKVQERPCSIRIGE